MLIQKLMCLLIQAMCFSDSRRGAVDADSEADVLADSDALVLADS